MLFGQKPGRKYRQDNQTGNRGRPMGIGVFWEEGSPFLCSFSQPQKKQDVTTFLQKGTEPYG